MSTDPIRVHSEFISVDGKIEKRIMIRTTSSMAKAQMASDVVTSISCAMGGTSGGMASGCICPLLVAGFSLLK